MAPTTRWFSGSVKSTSGSAFVRRAFFHYLIRYRPWSLGRSQRTPDTVKKSYDVERARERDAQLDYESVVFGPPGEEDFVLENDRVHFGKLSHIRRRFLESMVTSFNPWIANPPPDSVIVEFGCGSGRNLFFLQRQFPAIRFVGLELSPVSVALARDRAKKFQLPVEFREADVTASLAPIEGRVVVAFSSHALEQMPRIFPGAVKNMLSLSKGAVFFFEPVPELYGGGLRGAASRLRSRHLDRLRGLLNHLQDLKADIRCAERTGLAQNPLNETCKIEVAVTRGQPGDRPSSPTSPRV